MDPQTRRKIAEQDELDAEYSAATRRMLAGGRIEPIVWDRLGHNFRGSVKDSYRKARRRRAHYLFRLACVVVMLSSTAFTVDIRLQASLDCQAGELSEATLDCQAGELSQAPPTGDLEAL